MRLGSSAAKGKNKHSALIYTLARTTETMNHYFNLIFISVLRTITEYDVKEGFTQYTYVPIYYNKLITINHKWMVNFSTYI